jgi:hypothetical protein
MPQTILSSVLSAPTLSIAGDTDQVEIAQNLKVSKVSIKLRARIFRHKREDGVTIVDARVTEPKRVEIDVFVPTLDDLALLNAAQLDRTETYTLKSRGLIFKNMMMEDGHIKQTPDMLSASPVHVVFQELLMQSGAGLPPPAVAQPADASIIDRGIQTIKSSVQTVQGLAQTVVNNVGSAVTSVGQNIGL